VITRAEFETLVGTIQPDMTPRARRQFATRYASALIAAQKAHEMGLDKGQEFEQHMNIARLSIVSEELTRALQDRAQISDKEIEDYYRKNMEDYEEAALQRMFIPRIQQLPTPKEKLSDAQDKERKQSSEKTMKAEADRLRARAAAGEDFNALQDEAFELAGIHMGPSNTSMGKTQRGTLSPKQTPVFDLKPGEVSALLDEPSGYIIYRLIEKTTQPLEEVQGDIRSTLRAKRMQEQVQSLLDSATPALDDRYFGTQNAP